MAPKQPSENHRCVLAALATGPLTAREAAEATGLDPKAAANVITYLRGQRRVVEFDLVVRRMKIGHATRDQQVWRYIVPAADAPVDKNAPKLRTWNPIVPPKAGAPVAPANATPIAPRAENKTKRPALKRGVVLAAVDSLDEESARFLEIYAGGIQW